MTDTTDLINRLRKAVNDDHVPAKLYGLIAEAAGALAALSASVTEECKSPDDPQPKAKFDAWGEHD